MSGALKTAYHVSASKLQLTKTAEIYGSASMGYISSSGDLTASGTGSFGGGIDSSTATGSFGQVTAVGDVSSSGTGSFMDVFIDDNLEVQGDVNLHGNISGSGTATASFGHISASGDISTSTAVHSVQYYTDSILALTGNQSSNTVKLGGASSVTQLHGLSIDVSGSISMSGDMTLTGDISSSGRISASSGFETDAGTTSNFGTISSSGNLIISGDVSASGRISASNGFQAGTLSTSSFGYLSASGTAYFGDATVVINGNAGHITASGNISASGTVYAQSFESPGDVEIDINDSINVAGGVTASGNISASGAVYGTQIFVGSGGALAALSGDGGTNIVKLGGASSGTQIHGVSIDVSGSVSMSGALSMSGANASISTDQGGIYAGSAISSSEHLIGNLIQQHTAGVTNFAVDSLGQITASGQISSSAGLAGTALTLTTAGVHKASIDASGNVAAEGLISSSGLIAGRSATFASAGINALTITTAGAVSASSTLAGTALTLTTAGVHKASIDASGNVAAEGNISSSATIQGTGFLAKTNGITNFAVDALGQVTASGQISSSAGLAGTALTISTAGVTKASVTADGTGSFLGGIDAGAGNATGSFGYVSASGDISTSTAVHSVQYYTDSLLALTGDQGTNVVKLGGASSVTQIHGLSIDISGSVSMSGDLGVVNGTVYAPFYSNYHAVTDDQVLTVTSSGVPIVVTGAVTVVLPAVAIGHSYWIINGNADGIIIKISPNANDKFIINAAGAAGTDDKDLELNYYCRNRRLYYCRFN